MGDLRETDAHIRSHLPPARRTRLSSEDLFHIVLKAIRLTCLVPLHGIPLHAGWHLPHVIRYLRALHGVEAETGFK